MLKPREERRKVLVGARMRCGASWIDVCIVNIASQGLGLQAASPPKRGEYLEIRRGRHVIVGRVVWNSGRRFGVQARGTLPVHSIVNEPDGAAAAAAPAAERRAEPRALQVKHEASRNDGRRFEFAFVAAGGLCLVLVVAAMVQETLARPLAVISATLAKN